MVKEPSPFSALFLFAGCPEAADVVRDAETVAYQKGEIIYDAHHCRQALGVVLHGRAEAVAAGDERTVLSAFGEGDVFGAAALFGMTQPYVSCVRAVSECAVCFLPEEMLKELFLRCPQTAVNYIAFLSAKIRLLNGKIAVLTQNSTEGRLYRYLVENCGPDGRLTAPMARSRLARTLNMGRTSLYRALDALENKQLLVRRDDTWEVIR